MHLLYQYDCFLQEFQQRIFIFGQSQFCTSSNQLNSYYQQEVLAMKRTQQMTGKTVQTQCHSQMKKNFELEIPSENNVQMKIIDENLDFFFGKCSLERQIKNNQMIDEYLQHQQRSLHNMSSSESGSQNNSHRLINLIHLTSKQENLFFPDTQKPQIKRQETIREQSIRQISNFEEPLGEKQTLKSLFLSHKCQCSLKNIQVLMRNDHVLVNLCENCDCLKAQSICIFSECCNFCYLRKKNLQKQKIAEVQQNIAKSQDIFNYFDLGSKEQRKVQQLKFNQMHQLQSFRFYKEPYFREQEVKQNNQNMHNIYINQNRKISKHCHCNVVKCGIQKCGCFQSGRKCTLKCECYNCENLDPHIKCQKRNYINALSVTSSSGMQSLTSNCQFLPPNFDKK